MRLLIAIAFGLVLAACTTPMQPVKPLPAAHPYARPSSPHVRVVAYNVWKNSFLNDIELQQRFTRLVRALNADVWLLQEVWGKDWEVRAFFNRVLPLPNGASWHVRHARTQVTVSRWPIRHHRWSTGQRTGWYVGLTLVDLPDARFARDLYAVNVGMTCCGGRRNDPKRQAQADELARWLRVAKRSSGRFRIPSRTPIVIGGDLNIIASDQPMQTVRTGNIINEKRFGRDAPPDWDGTALTDAHPRHNGTGGDWTWRSDGSRFPPGRLDYILYSDSVLARIRTFSVDTTTLPGPLLKAAGLTRLDVVIGVGRKGSGLRWDHLPLVLDARLLPGSPTETTAFSP